MNLLKLFNGDKSKISACFIKEKGETLENISGGKKKLMEILELIEYTLPTRLADDTYQGMLNFLK